MSISLTTFKQVIPANVLARGQEYYRGGKVFDLSIEDEGVWSAQVVGTETYDVQIEQHGDGTLTCTCTCPYDLGEHCKHIAAVLYAIEDTSPENLKEKKTRQRGKKKESRAGKLQKAVDSATETELRAFVLEMAKADRAVYNRIMLHFGGPDNAEGGYDRMVKDALRAGRAEYGMIDYRGASIAAKRIEDLLKRADDLVQGSRTDEALPIYQAVAGNVVEALPEADDSNGSLSGCISEAIEGIEQCASQGGATTKQAVLTYCLEQAQSDRFREWDWRWSLLNIAAATVKTLDQRAALFKTLDQLDESTKPLHSVRGNFIADYRLEQTAQIRLSVIERLDGAAAADAFIQAHLDMRRFKEMVIERHIERGELKQAKALVVTAIQEAEKQRLPGLVSNYNEYRLTIAQREGDTQTTVQLARERLLQHPDETYYTMLKKAIPAEQWPSFVESLLRDCRKSDYGADLTAWILAREGMWDRLLALVKESSPGLAEQYRAELEKRYPNDMAVLYEEFCLKTLKHSSDRKGYQRACEFLRRMKKLGQTVRAETVKNTLREKNANRPALLDELNKV